MFLFGTWPFYRFYTHFTYVRVRDMMIYVWNFAMMFILVLDTTQKCRFWSQPSHLCRATQTRHIPMLGAIIDASMLDVSKVDTTRSAIAGQGGR
jgi:hypothetical protein